MKDKNAGLTPKQEQFCIEYLIDFNGTAAAIRAGYSPKTARQIAAQNLSKLNIQNRIRELRDGINRQKIATAAERMELLTEIMRGEMKEEIVSFSPENRIYFRTEKAPHITDRIRAIVELDKIEKATMKEKERRESAEDHLSNFMQMVMDEIEENPNGYKE